MVMVPWGCVDILSDVVFDLCRFFRVRIIVAHWGRGVVGWVENEPQIHLLMRHPNVAIVGMIGNNLILHCRQTDHG